MTSGEKCNFFGPDGMYRTHESAIMARPRLSKDTFVRKNTIVRKKKCVKARFPSENEMVQNAVFDTPLKMRP